MNFQDPTSMESHAAITEQDVSVDDMQALQISEAAQASLDPSTSTGPTQVPAAAAPLPLPAPIPIPPLPLPMRRVSGRYRSPAAGFQLELRVDVDGTKPLNRVSGDFYQISGATTTYFGSFVVNSPAISVTATTVTIKGLGQYTFSAGAPVVQVTIARRSLLQPAAPAVLQFFTTGGSPGASYTCAFESVYFRSLRIETDRVSDATLPVFASYNTGSFPSGGPARTLSVVSAYAEAGIEMVPTGGSDVVNISEAADTKWSDSELHASMERHFTLWRDLPQWAVWQVVAQKHDLGPGLLGIMFDQKGKQRQGCAVFHGGLGGTTADKLRLQLYTYVHELGHCFNLLHSWQKSLANPPAPNRPAAKSWMNYPWNYPLGGEAGFWKDFGFAFDDQELIHLRHAFRNNIVMGGSDFAVGSALESPQMFNSPIRDDSGLQLEISSPRSLALGEPVVVSLKLTTSDTRGKTVHPYLHPASGLVQIAIRKPNREITVFEPLVEHCVAGAEVRIDHNAMVDDSAYIGYGKDGLYFEQAGMYQIRAVYSAMDGSQVVSNILNLRVRNPVTAKEDELADLFMGEEQGTLLSLLGSDSETLQNGNRAFDEVLEKHGDHPLANYVRLVKGVNAQREFKTITPEKDTRLEVRKPQHEESARMLSAVVNAGMLDGVTQEMATATLADVQYKLGDAQNAAETQRKLKRRAARAARGAGSR